MYETHQQFYNVAINTRKMIVFISLASSQLIADRSFLPIQTGTLLLIIMKLKKTLYEQTTEQQQLQHTTQHLFTPLRTHHTSHATKNIQHVQTPMQSKYYCV